MFNDLFTKTYLNIIMQSFWGDLQIKLSRTFNPQEVKDYLRKYKDLKQNNWLSGADLNIQQMDFQTLKAVVDQKYPEFEAQMNRRAVKRTGKDGAEFIGIHQFTVQGKSRPYQIWYILTHAAAQYYGHEYKGIFVPWCISTQNLQSFKQTYSESNFYFLICLDQSLKESKNFKIAVQINLDGTVQLNDIENKPGTCKIPQISQYFKQNFKWRYQPDKKYDLNKLKKYQPEAYQIMKKSIIQPIKNHLNPQTGRYDFEQISIQQIRFLIADGKFIIPFGRINGDFICYQNQLTSLEGAPEFVKGNFDCSGNQLNSLEGAPESVGGIFDCSENLIISLKGAPKSIGKNFVCYQNQLVSLEGAPESVLGDFNCSYNHLASLEGAPESVGESFNCSYNQLTSVKGSPKSIKQDFDCSCNRLTSLEGAPKSTGGYFNCSHNRLVSLKGAPKSVKQDFDCSHNKLASLEGAPEYIGGVFNYFINPGYPFR